MEKQPASPVEILQREVAAAMPAGIKLDDALAQILFGYARIHIIRGSGIENMLIEPEQVEFYCSHFGASKGWVKNGNRRQGSIWPYSVSITHAWRVVDAMHAKGYWLKLVSPFGPDQPCFAAFDQHGVADSRPPWEASAETPALAICRSALLLLLAPGSPAIQEGAPAS